MYLKCRSNVWMELQPAGKNDDYFMGQIIKVITGRYAGRRFISGPFYIYYVSMMSVADRSAAAIPAWHCSCP